MDSRDPATPDVDIRLATPEDALDVRRVLDASMLELDANLDARIDAGDVLVGTVARDRGEAIVGALVVTWPGSAAVETSGSDAVETSGSDAVETSGLTAHVEAIAVRRERRGRGIGTALLEAAIEHARESGADRLTAAFDDDLEPFYDRFDVQRREGRSWGTLEL